MSVASDGVATVNCRAILFGNPDAPHRNSRRLSSCVRPRYVCRGCRPLAGQTEARQKTLAAKYTSRSTSMCSFSRPARRLVSPTLMISGARSSMSCNKNETLRRKQLFIAQDSPSSENRPSQDSQRRCACGSRELSINTELSMYNGCVTPKLDLLISLKTADGRRWLRCNERLFKHKAQPAFTAFKFIATEVTVKGPREHRLKVVKIVQPSR